MCIKQRKYNNNIFAMTRLSRELSPLLTEKVLNNLKTRRIFTVLDFLQETPDNIAHFSELLYKDAVSLRQMLISRFASFPINALEAFKDFRTNSAIIPCNIPSFDALLNAGLKTGEVVEIYGSSGSGKTQLCLTITVNVALNLKQQVWYIDCKHDFSGTRLQSILEAHGIKDEEQGMAMERVKVIRPESVHQLLAFLPQLYQEIQNQRDSQIVPRLVIIDSLPALFYGLMGESSSSMLNLFGLLNSLGIALKQMACELHLAVLLVNIAKHWQIEDEETGNIVKEQNMPAFGKQWLSFPSSRLLLTRGENTDVIVATVVKSTRVPNNRSCNLYLSDKGVVSCL